MIKLHESWTRNLLISSQTAHATEPPRPTSVLADVPACEWQRVYTLITHFLVIWSGSTLCWGTPVQNFRVIKIFKFLKYGSWLNVQIFRVNTVIWVKIQYEINFFFTLHLHLMFWILIRIASRQFKHFEWSPETIQTPQFSFLTFNQNNTFLYQAIYEREVTPKYTNCFGFFTQTPDKISPISISMLQEKKKKNQTYLVFQPRHVARNLPNIEGIFIRGQCLPFPRLV